MLDGTSRLALIVAALVGGLALFVAGLVIAIEMRQAVASPNAAPSEGVCVMPWAIDGDETAGPAGRWGLEPTGLLFLPAYRHPVQGEVGALALYGNAARDYRQAIITPCAGGDRGACDQAEPQVWVGEILECNLKIGNLVGITHHALSARYGEGTDCDVATYDAAVSQAATELCQDRAVFIPIIDAFPPAYLSAPMEILGMATFYIAGWARHYPPRDEDIDGDTVPDAPIVWGYLLQIEGPNQPPDCSAAAPSITRVWPANHKMVAVDILGITDPDGDPITIAITAITQDEPVRGPGYGRASPDGAGIGTDTARVRAERAGTRRPPGDGRMYHIHFEASDGRGGACSGVVNVGVPHDRRPGSIAVDDGESYDSTAP